MRIESGVARRALMRRGMVVVLLLAFAGWFGWDGWVNYPHENMKEAMGNFPVVPEGSVPVNGAVTAKSAKVFVDKMGGGQSVQVTLADLEREWGQPAYPQKGTPAAASEGGSAEQAAFFVGPYGWAKVSLAGDRVAGIQWTDAKKDYSSIAVQKLLAAVLAVIAMIPLGLLLGSMSGKYVLDDEGLTLPGKGQIRSEQMVGIDLKDLQKRGIVRLKYKDEQGAEATAVLDEEACEKFEEIVLALCQKNGWEEQLAQTMESEEPPAGGQPKA